ncbi:MAG: hypothetical protein RLY40_1372 [Pseudomonadota bacterium]
MLTEYLLSRENLLMAPAMVIMAGALVSLLTLLLRSDWKSGNAPLPEEVKSIN